MEEPRDEQHASQPPASRPRRRWARPLVVAVIVVGVLIGGYAWYLGKRYKTRDVHGEIIYLDLASRTAALEYIDADTGQAYEFGGQLPANARVVIGGQAGELADLHVGDEVTMHYTVDRLTREWVKLRVLRP